MAPGDKVQAAYRDLLAELAEKKKEEIAERKRPKKKPKSKIVMAVLAVILPPVAAGLWIFQPFAPALPPPVLPQDDWSAWRPLLIEIATEVEEWRDSAGALPATLEAMGLQYPAISYVIVGPTTFELRAFAEDRALLVWGDGDSVGVGPRPVPPPPGPVDFSP